MKAVLIATGSLDPNVLLIRPNTRFACQFAYYTQHSICMSVKLLRNQSWVNLLFSVLQDLIIKLDSR